MNFADATDHHFGDTLSDIVIKSIRARRWLLQGVVVITFAAASMIWLQSNGLAGASQVRHRYSLTLEYLSSQDVISFFIRRFHLLRFIAGCDKKPSYIYSTRIKRVHWQALVGRRRTRRTIINAELKPIKEILPRRLINKWVELWMSQDFLEFARNGLKAPPPHVDTTVTRHSRHLMSTAHTSEHLLTPRCNVATFAGCLSTPHLESTFFVERLLA